MRIAGGMADRNGRARRRGVALVFVLVIMTVLAALAMTHATVLHRMHEHLTQIDRAQRERWAAHTPGRDAGDSTPKAALTPRPETP